MDLVSLDRLLNLTPVIVQGMHPVSLAYLSEDVNIYPSVQELAWKLDIPQTIQPHRALSFDTSAKYATRFPVVTVNHDPFTTDLNRVLFDRYDFLATHMLTHAQVAERILSEVHRFDTVIFILLDGLSYTDCKDWPGIEPCLAAHPTITRVGFPTIVGNPPIAARLFTAGFNQRIGFTYWDRVDNRLTKCLFQTITETVCLDPAQPTTFNQIIDWMSLHDLSGTYIQIVRSALDEYAEGHRVAIPRKAIINKLRNDLEAISDILEHKGRPAILFAVADHGILWKEDGHKIELINMPGARYLEGRSGPGRGRSFKADDQDYWVLDYPQMGRQWLSNEQGIHGGMSFEESIVPFIQWEVNLLC